MLSSVPVNAADGIAPVPVATMNLPRSDGTTTTVAFLTEDVIAITRSVGFRGTVPGALYTVNLENGKLRVLQEVTLPFARRPWELNAGLYPVSGDRLLLTLTESPLLLSRELGKLADLALGIVFPPEHHGDTLASFIDINHWKLYRLGPPPLAVRSGAGEVLSVSNGFIAIRSENDLRVETIGGVPAGHFQVPPRSSCQAKVIILGQNRLLATGCEEDRIVDFNGKKLVRLPARSGWGFQFGQSNDGSRVVFNNHTRNVPLLQKLFESLTGAPVESTGETVEIVETARGGVCFSLDGPASQFGDRNTDISPSGRFVAAVMDDTLSVYRVPDACALK